MQQRLFLLAFTLNWILITGCQVQDNSLNTVSGQDLPSKYLSLDGIWVCTPETALDYPASNLISTMMIRGSADQRLTARGCFMWKGKYHHDWELLETAFNDSSNQISILDADGDKYIGQADKDMLIIRGFIYSEDSEYTDPVDTVDFVRADEDLAITLFYPIAPGKDGRTTYAYKVPESLDDQLQTASVFEFIRDSSSLYELMNRIVAKEYGRLESLLIMKNGQLVLEEYFYGYDRSQLHNIHSCTKSISSLLMGIALNDQQEYDISTPLFELLPQYDMLSDSGKEKITLEHLLTMTTGYSEDDMEGFPEYDDQLLNILSRPLASEPGATFRYSNDLSLVAGGVLHQICGKHADQIAKEHIFDPLGIDHYRWEFVGELPQCHSNLKMVPRDMAKIGQLVLNEGKWDHKQIVPSDWIKESTSPQVRESEYFNYAYYWWHRSEINNHWWPEPTGGYQKEHDMALALGFGGQYIMVIRDLNMVIVTTSSDYSNGFIARQKIPMAIEVILPMFD